MTRTVEAQAKAYLQSRKNPLLNSFGARSVLKQRNVAPVKSKKRPKTASNKPKQPSKPRTPSPLSTQAVTPFVSRARGALERMMADLEAYEASLAKMSPAELERLAREEQQKEQQEHLNTAEIETITQTQPDYEYWARFQSWTGEEFVALILDADPQVATMDKISPYATQHDFAREFSSLYTLVSRSFPETAQQTHYSPLMFANWARRIDLKLPSPLKACIERNKFIYEAPSEPKPFTGTFKNRLDAQAYTWLAESDPKRFKGKYKEAASYLANQRNEKRDNLAILTSMRRGLGITKPK